MTNDKIQRKSNKNFKKSKEDDEVKIKYDIITPEERDPQPKMYDEIEY